MNHKQRDLLIEQATTAHRPHDRQRGVAAHPAFWDLDAAGRIQLHAVTEQQRAIEAALHPESLSTTARVVLARIHGG